MAEGLPMRALTRMWQMLLKALEEVANAPNAMMSAEMSIIRLTHVADLPSPEDLVRKLQDAPKPPSGGGGGSVTGASGGATAVSGGAPRSVTQSGATTMLAAEPNMDALARYARFEDVVQLIRTRRDMKLLVEVENYVRLVKYSPGRIEFEPTDRAPTKLASQLASRLQNWTGVRWVITVASTGGGKTIGEVKDAHRNDMYSQAMSHPLVQSVLVAFPGAEIKDVRGNEFDGSGNEDIVPIDPDDVDDLDDNWDPLDPFGED
jgi:DNA polymerase-3 subunit gamma/tau